MTPTFKRALAAVFWFFAGHISCAALHDLYEIMRR
jgi:hypothetical protein